MIKTGEEVSLLEADETRPGVIAQDASCPMVSIIIPVYNGSNYLSEAIESALAQSYGSCEIIVVNDGSNDDGKTEAIALSYKNQIRYFYKENGGVASALNFAVKKMRGDYFSWLSHDDLYTPDKIEKEMEALKNSKDSDLIVFCNAERLFEETGHIVGPVYQEFFSIEKLQEGVFPVLVGAVSGCTVLFHKKYFTEVGGFDGHLMTTQDYDFWFRLFRNKKTIFLKENLVISRVHRDQGSKTISNYRYEQRDLYISFMQKLTDLEKENIAGSKINFYSLMVDTFLRIKANNDCIKYVLEEWKTESYNGMGQTCAVDSWIRQNFPKNSGNIYLFGAGKIGRPMLISLLLRQIRVKGIIDNAKEKQGKLVENVPCMSLQTVEKEAIVVVCVLEKDGILAQLNEGGYFNVIDYTKMNDLLKMIPIVRMELTNYCNRVE